MGNLAQDLVGEGGKHPPGPALLLPEQGEQLFAIGGQGEAVFSPLLQPDLHILPGDLPAVVGTQSDAGVGLAARQDIPVLQHLFRCVLLEVDQFKQLDLVPLRGEDQFVLLAVEAHFEGYVIKGQVQNILHLGHQFIPPLMVLVLIHPLTQLCLLLSKFLPCRLRPLPEALREPGQSDSLLTPFNELLGIPVTGAGFQRRLEIGQRPALLVQVVVGITHAEVPAMVPCEIRLMGLQQGNGLAEQLPVPRRGLVVVGPGQFAVHLRGALLGGDGLQGLNDLLILVVFVPDLTLVQQSHMGALLYFFLFCYFVCLSVFLLRRVREADISSPSAPQSLRRRSIDRLRPVTFRAVPQAVKQRSPARCRDPAGTAPGIKKVRKKPAHSGALCRSSPQRGRTAPYASLLSVLSDPPRRVRSVGLGYPSILTEAATKEHPPLNFPAPAFHVIYRV